MRRTPIVGSLAVAALLVAAFSLPAPAEARGRHGAVYVGAGFGGFYGWGPYWGWGAPYWGWGWGWGPGPYSYGGGPALLGYAMMAGMGGLDVDAKPNRAEVWVDGKFVADARDLDGDPSYLWLEKGPHHIAVYKAGFKTFEDDIDVTRGVKRELKLRLEPGDSLPPGPRPADRERGNNKEKSKDKGRQTGGTGGEVD